MEDTSLKLPIETVAALQSIATAEDATIGTVIRDAIKRELFRRDRARSAQRADEQLVAPLRALLADDLAYASG